MKTRIRFGFRGKNQIPWFMAWREYVAHDGQVLFADILFQIEHHSQREWRKYGRS